MNQIRYAAHRRIECIAISDVALHRTGQQIRRDSVKTANADSALEQLRDDSGPEFSRRSGYKNSISHGVQVYGALMVVDLIGLVVMRDSSGRGDSEKTLRGLRWNDSSRKAPRREQRTNGRCCGWLRKLIGRWRLVVFRGI